MKYNFLNVIHILLLSAMFVLQGLAASSRNEKVEETLCKLSEVFEIGKKTDVFRFRELDNKIPNQWYGKGYSVAEIGTRWSSTFIKKYPLLVPVTISLFLIALMAGVLFLNINRNQKLIKTLQENLHEKTVCLNIVNDERDWLIREIHHRVKNNLQIVMSLLNTQSVYETNKAANQAIRNSQHRMYAISLVHQKLYQADSLSEIDMVVYIHELVAYLADAFEAPDHISFDFDMAPLLLEVSMAVSLGLIVNEAVNNILKYAFPTQRGGRVNISISFSDGISYKMRIADNGIGLGGNKKERADSLGTTLMAGLARQLGGSYNLSNNNGVEIVVIFDKKPKAAPSELNFFK